ncbi:hypothetical protein CHUAL_003980 [Chamberlinius hualienensis]
MLLLLCLVTLLTGSLTSGQQCSVDRDFKLDCYPDDRNATQEQCEQRGCCYQYQPPPQINFTTENNMYPMMMGPPSCFYPTDYPHGYSTINVTTTSTGVTAFLSRNQPSFFPGDIQILKLVATYEYDYRLRVKITDANDPNRHEAIYPVIPDVDNPVDYVAALYEFQFLQPDGFQVIRKATGEVIFKANFQNFIFADQVIQFTASLPSQYLYGIGAHRDTFAHNFDFQRINIFAAEYYPEYSLHPFYMMMENSHSSHAVFLHTEYGMDVWLQKAPAITYRIIGGVLDFYFFLGPTPRDVMTQYTDAINKQFIPPYWSLGFHLCRYGYYSIESLFGAYNRTKNAGVPYDVQWTDIDAFYDYRSFTYNTVAFHDLPSFVDLLHQNGMKYICMFEPSITLLAEPGTYPAMDDGLAMDTFVKDYKGDVIKVQVWANESAFVDFTHPNATIYWTKQFNSYYQKLQFDGAWIDMDEPSNFISGSVNGCPANSTLEYPPFVPGVTGGVLAHDTLCMTAQHYLDTHYHIHNLFSLYMSFRTSEALESVHPGKRQFIISRGTSVGQHNYTGHWTGDIWSDWDEMRYSIPAVLNYNIFGFSLVGADMCGFGGNQTSHPSATVPLCQRWTQLAAFYPFCINHNNNDNPDKDPVAMGPEVLNTTIQALTLRYYLLPYIYTSFYEANTQGLPVARPLLMEFPDDTTTYTIGNEYLFGPALLIVPVLEEDVTTVYPYFPRGIWYMIPTGETIVSTGNYYQLDVPVDVTKVGLRGGYIVPTQDPSQTTAESRQNNFGLLVGLDEFGEANGYLFWDDGETAGTLERGEYNLIRFRAGNTAIVTSIERSGYEPTTPMILGHAYIYGLQKEPQTVYADSVSVPFNYDSELKLLRLDSLNLLLQDPITISWF